MDNHVCVVHCVENIGKYVESKSSLQCVMDDKNRLRFNRVPAVGLIGFSHYLCAQCKPHFPSTSPHVSATSFPSLVFPLILPSFIIYILFIPLPQLFLPRTSRVKPALW